MSLLTDQNGRPIIFFDTENTKERIKGLEEYRVNKFLINNMNID